MNKAKVSCVVVTYNPSDIFFELIKRLLSNDIKVIVVDNSPNRMKITQNEIFYHWLGGNKGIAAAQNKGIELSSVFGTEYIAFLDQDSKIDSNQVLDLVKTIERTDFSIAAPISINRKTNVAYSPVEISTNGAVKKIPVRAREIINTNFVISSGTVVTKTVFDNVGMMDEKLFIDYVDTEWCIRAASKGYRIAVNSRVEMEHEIGDGDINCFFFKVPVHSAQRRFYRVRNAFYLLTYDHVPTRLAIREVIVTALQQIIIVICRKERVSYIKSYLSAVSQGVKYFLKG